MGIILKFKDLSDVPAAKLIIQQRMGVDLKPLFPTTDKAELKRIFTIAVPASRITEVARSLPMLNQLEYLEASPTRSTQEEEALNLESELQR